MADPTAVNAQITDAVTQTNVKVVAEARPRPSPRSTRSPAIPPACPCRTQSTASRP